MTVQRAAGAVPGDVYLLVRDQSYCLRLTFAAALAIEADLEAGLVTILLERLQKGEIGATAHVLRHLAAAGGTVLTVEQAGALVMADYKACSAAISRCIADGLNGEADTPAPSEAPTGVPPEKKPQPLSP